MSQSSSPLPNASQGNDIDALLGDAMQEVNQKIQRALRSDVVLIDQMGHYIIGAGGKRLRPKLVILAAMAHGYDGSHHTQIAAVIEFIHTATLLHDDVVDSSNMRRGKETANNVWGNEAAVLVGDFLYSRSFEMMVEVGRMQVMEILSAATNKIAAGEVMQLMNIGEAEVPEQRYMEVIEAKTAKLFEAATQLGAVLAEASDDQQKAMARYGSHLGMGFQLVDDVLDYTADSAELGKNAGDDLAEGKPTLPLIYALQSAQTHDADRIKQALHTAQNTGELPTDEVSELVAFVCQSGAIERTLEKAEEQVRLAVLSLSGLDDNPYKQALVDIAESSVKRRT